MFRSIFSPAQCSAVNRFNSVAVFLLSLFLFFTFDSSLAYSQCSPQPPAVPSGLILTMAPATAPTGAITPNIIGCDDGSASWTFCAWENQSCNFSGTKEVRYGSNDVYVSQVFTGGVSCDNNVFGDPLYGVQKKCEFRDAPAPVATWTFCALENERCNFSGTKKVRYGANDLYVSQMFTNGVSCDNTVFGDPVYGVPKKCEYSDASNLATVATPVISPSGGSYSSSVSVTMQSSTSGASIYYTTNGSTPTQASLLYTGAISLTSSTVVKSKAFKSGANPSGEASASFTLAAQPPIANGTTRFADGSLGVTSCSNYNPGTRQCSGGTEIAYGGVLAIQNASNASAATDIIQVRAFNGTYVGTDELGSIELRGGNSLSSRFQIRGYQNEIPTLRAITGHDFVHINQVLFDPMPDNRDVICVVPGIGWRVENSEITNCGAGGINGGSNFEFINLNVHHTGFNSSHCELGPGQCHGLYSDNSPQSGGTVTAIIDGGEYHHNEGWGIHCYAHCTNVTIRNVTAYSNGGAGVGALNDASNTNVVIYNTLAYDNGGGIAASAGGILVHNVTAVNNRDAGLVHEMLGTARDSIILGGYTTKTFHFGTGAFLGDSTASNNVTSGDMNALFVDAANGNFTPRVPGVGADLSSGAE